MSMESQPMKDDELGRYMCVAQGGCLHRNRTITSDGVWVKSPGPDSLNPGSHVYSSAHRDCFEAWAARDWQPVARQPVKVTYRDKPAGSYDYDVVPGFDPVTWGDLRGQKYMTADSAVIPEEDGTAAEMLLSERIREDGITITSEPRMMPPDDEDSSADMQWFDVTLHRGDREFCLPYGLGPAREDEPEADDVMSTVIMGVRSVRNNGSFRAWADDWGFDPEDEKKLAMYEQWRTHMGRLMVFLGSERFHAYMDETQDDI